MANIDWVEMLIMAQKDTYYHNATFSGLRRREIIRDWVSNRIRKQLAAGRLAQRQVEAMRREADRWSKDANWCAKAILAAGDIQEAE